MANSVRIGAYRGASFVSSAFLVWVAAHRGWHAAFLAGAGLLGALALATLVLPSPRRESAHPPTLAEPIRALLAAGRASGPSSSSRCSSSWTSRRWTR